MKKVGIIIINFNGKKDTDECLASLEKMNIDTVEVLTVVVDNASQEKYTLPSKKFTKQHINVIHNNYNLGFTGGNNVGITYALNNGCDYIMLLNNDTTVQPNLVKELVTVLESNKKIGIVAPKIYFAEGFEYHKSRYTKQELGKVIWYAGGIMDWNNIIGRHRGVDEVDHGQYNTVEKTDYASGCCFMTTKAVLTEAGIFDDNYFLYYEESDLCERIKRLGYQIMYVPSAVVWHKNAQSSGGSGSSLQDYYISRNRMLFGMKYAPMRTKFALTKESVRILMNGRVWQKKGIQDYYKRKYGKGSYSI